MGVYYSSTVGYGVAVPNNEAPPILKAMEPYEDGDVPVWLEENGFDLIGYQHCGNQWSGPEVYFFYIKGTDDYSSHDFADTIVEFADSPAITNEAVSQLANIRILLGLKSVIGWKLINNVS